MGLGFTQVSPSGLRALKNASEMVPKLRAGPRLGYNDNTTDDKDKPHD